MAKLTIPLADDAARELARAAKDMETSPEEVAQSAVESWLHEKRSRSVKFKDAAAVVDRRLARQR